MKHLLLLICLISFFSANAQTGSQSTKEQGLTAQELATAKELYIKMMQTEPYKIRLQKVKLFADKTNRVMIFPNSKQTVGMTPEDRRNFMQAKLKENLADTDFESVKEAMDLWDETASLTEKQAKENEQLFSLMTKATYKQLKEIKQPEMRR